MCISVLYKSLFSFPLLWHAIQSNPLIGTNVEMANAHQFPFIVSIQTKRPYNRKGDTHFCTGSLITSRHVITAEHCVRNFQFKHVHVAVGVVNIEDSTVKYNVKWWVTYDQWSEGLGLPKESDNFNDIAILSLSKPVNQGNVKPIGLTRSNALQLYRTKAMIVGWGKTSMGEMGSHLRKANVDILSREACAQRVYLVSNVRFKTHHSQLCTAASPLILISDGDSGSPLIDNNNNLAGVTSGTSPKDSIRWGSFSESFLNQYEINIHVSVDYYRQFINAVSGLD